MQTVSLYVDSFFSYRLLCDNASNVPKMTWNTTRAKVTHICSTTIYECMFIQFLTCLYVYRCNVTFDTPSNSLRYVYTFMPYQAVIVVYNGSNVMARGTSYNSTSLRSTIFITSVINCVFQQKVLYRQRNSL